MSPAAFTGERLHAGRELFRVDLARHRAAYRFAMEQAANSHVLDLGCGSGYGTAELAEAASLVVGVDRSAPDASARRGSARYVRADLNAIPLVPALFIVLYGVALDVCNRAAIEGLLERGHERITLVTDATRPIRAERAEALLAGWRDRGIELATTAEVLGGIASGAT